MPGRVRPARSSCGSAPAAPWVCTTCAVVCAEAQGCFPAREQGAAAKEAPQPAPFATTALIAPFLAPPLAPHRVRLCVENKRQTVRTKQNTFPWRGRQPNKPTTKPKRFRSARLALWRCEPYRGLRRPEPGPPEPPLGPCPAGSAGPALEPALSTRPGSRRLPVTVCWQNRKER